MKRNSKTVIAALIVMTTALLFSSCTHRNSNIVGVRVFSKYEIRQAVLSEKKSGAYYKLFITGDRIEVTNRDKTVSAEKSFTFLGRDDAVYEIEVEGVKRMIPGIITARLINGEQGIIFVSTMGMEDYVTCVLSSELDNTLYSPELAKAHAVVIRTFAVLNTHRHAEYDFCDLTHCEVFKGVAVPYDMWRTPVRETKGIILKGVCAKDTAYFSACCGGVTENAGEFARGSPGKCGQSKKDEYNGVALCSGHRYYKWSKHLKKSEMQEAFRQMTGEKNATIENVRVVKRSVSGRVKEMDFSYRLDGAEKHAVLDVNKYFSIFGRIAGWALVPSKFFEISRDGEGFMLNGRGHGHGVGLCLQGGAKLASMGWDYGRILKFYFSDLYL